MLDMTTYLRYICIGYLYSLNEKMKKVYYQLKFCVLLFLNRMEEKKHFENSSVGIVFRAFFGIIKRSIELIFMIPGHN